MSEWNIRNSSKFVTMDPETNKLIQMQTKAETSIRTISDIQLDTEGWAKTIFELIAIKERRDEHFILDELVFWRF